MKRKRPAEPSSEPAAKIAPKKPRTKRVVVEKPVELPKRKKKENGAQTTPTPTPALKKVKSETKKKVRIDETEGLKAKKEMAEAEPHFSAKELPAKIIKSKANKNLTEEVKVSPLTIQNTKKVHGTRGRKALAKTKAELKEVVDETPVIKEEILPVSNGLTEEDSDNEAKLKEQLHEEIDIKDEFNGVKQEVESDESDLEDYYVVKRAEKEAKLKMAKRQSATLMSKEDQLILAQKVLDAIPDGDQRSYKYRLHNLDWQNIAFHNYTIEQCQKVWTVLMKRVRCHRLLTEVAGDVKKMIELNDIPATRSGKPAKAKRHPDMPKRPLSSYFLYYIKQRDKAVKERPQLDTVDLNKYISELYQNLTAEKKQKYDMLAAKNREEYRIKMEEFLAAHPEYRKMKQTKRKVKKEKPPNKPLTPLKLFMQSEANREEIAVEDRQEFKEVCREKWRHMNDNKKLIWINLAEQHHANYTEEMKEYMSNHPEFKPKNDNSRVLSRREIDLKEKLAGKPKKPATTAYGLFISKHSSEFPHVPPKERWNLTSAKWKALTDDERDHYKVLLAQAMEQYESDFQAYLDSLPEEKRQAEILKSSTKKRKKPVPHSSVKKVSQPGASTSKTRIKVENPQPPPRSACKYFAQKTDSQDPKKDWKGLSDEEKKFYENELSVIKEKYIKDFETYLKSLSKKELAEFSAQRNAQDESDSSDFYESDDDSSVESSEDSD